MERNPAIAFATRIRRVVYMRASILMLLIARVLRDVIIYFASFGKGVPSKWYNDRFVTFIDLEFQPRSGK